MYRNINYCLLFQIFSAAADDIINNSSFNQGNDVWLFDCGIQTPVQILHSGETGNRVTSLEISKIFITHMHADHIMGLWGNVLTEAVNVELLWFNFVFREVSF
tara:strand:+ start:313 stop:621 length:309 start_codon:yes stop_codon:yes gene_type:complete